MKLSPLLSEYEARHLPVAEYCGTRSATVWPDEPALDPWPGSGLRLYDLSFRASLRVAGPEARKWLNGMITANVRDLAPGRVAPSFQLDPKGHILASMDVACDGPDSFVLLTSQDQAAALVERLRRFIFISKLTIEDRTEQLTALLLRGARAAEAWRGMMGAVELSPGRLLSLGTGGESAEFAIASAVGGGQIEVWVPVAAAVALWNRLRSVGAPAGTAAYERERILSGQPRFGVDITTGELPQETGQYEALDFTKGCYIGQEIVERIRARGAVHRQCRRIRFAARVEPGAALSAGGQPVGRITSATGEGADSAGSWIALAYVRRPHDAAGSEVFADSIRGQVMDIAAVGVPEVSTR